MKIQQKLTAALAALILISSCLPAKAMGNTAATAGPQQPCSNGLPSRAMDNTAVPAGQQQLCPNGLPSRAMDTGNLPEHAITPMDSAPPPEETPLQELAIATPEEPAAPAPEEAPMFRAYLEYTPHGYDVKGICTKIPPDTSQIQTLCSLDGETYPFYGTDWDLGFLETEDAGSLTYTKKQTCLYFSDEPLKSYLEGNSGSFWVKLRLTKTNGVTYETQAAAISRGTPKPVPAGITPIADFAPNLAVREFRPYRHYGKYQLTIREDTSPEEISSFLPDTLPIQIQFQLRPQDYLSTATGTIDCPVTWKPFSLPQLTAGKTITILDAVEKIVVPDGALLDTPMGIFQLDGTLDMDQSRIEDEVRLAFNVIGKDEPPAGVLSNANDGLHLAFSLKPTGATAIRAYACPDGGSQWAALPAVSLQEAANAQPSTANSGYALVIANSCEPYRSYLAAQHAGADPTPFFIGLRIEGGIYDGQTLILSWPGTYSLPPNLPTLSGSGGNEGNAGAGSKDDSTPEGQRPGLPQEPEDNTQNKPSDADDKAEQKPSSKPQDTNNKTEQKPGSKPQDTGNKTEAHPQGKPEKNLQDNTQNTGNSSNHTPPDSTQGTGNAPNSTLPNSTQGTGNNSSHTLPDSTQSTGNSPNNTLPDSTQGTGSSPNNTLPDNTQGTGNSSNNTQGTGNTPNSTLPGSTQDPEQKSGICLPGTRQNTEHAPENQKPEKQPQAKIPATETSPNSLGNESQQSPANSPLTGSFGTSAQLPALLQGKNTADINGSKAGTYPAAFPSANAGTGAPSKTALPEGSPKSSQKPSHSAPATPAGQTESGPNARHRHAPPALAAILAITCTAACIAIASKKKRWPPMAAKKKRWPPMAAKKKR